MGSRHKKQAELEKKAKIEERPLNESMKLEWGHVGLLIYLRKKGCPEGTKRALLRNSNTLMGRPATTALKHIGRDRLLAQIYSSHSLDWRFALIAEALTLPFHWSIAFALGSLPISTTSHSMNGSTWYKFIESCGFDNKLES